MLGLIELSQRSSGSEPQSLSQWFTPRLHTHTHTHTLLGKPKIGVLLPPGCSFYSSTKILMALKSMLPLLGPNCWSWPWPMQRIPSGRACWPVGIHRFDYEKGQRCFSSLSHKEGLVQRGDNATSKWHVKLTWLCAIIPAFDLTNVLVSSSTSVNTSTLLHSFLFRCQTLPYSNARFTPIKKIEKLRRAEWLCWRRRKKRTHHDAGKMLVAQLSLAVWLLLFELK